jgi:capsular exopolysaccharide synthesis family protein
MADLLIDESGSPAQRLSIEPKAPVPFHPQAQPSAPNHASPPEPAEDTEVHLSDYLRVLYKRRWPALTVFLVVFTSTCIYTFTATPIFNARVQILIEKEASNVVTFKEAVEQNQVTDDYYQTQYKILQSRALARRTLDSLQLWHHPQFDSPDASKSKGIRSTIASLFSRDSNESKAAEPPTADETRAQSRTIDLFLKDLLVTPIRNSRLVDVSYDSTDAVLAARVANGLAKAYIEQNMEFKFLSSKEASDWLSARLGEQRKQVENSEQALQRYRESSKDAVSLEDRQNIVVQRLADLNQAVTRAKMERIEKESSYNQIRAMQSDRTALDTFPAILGNGFIQQQKTELAELQRQQAQLGEKLGPNHPDMVKVVTAIRTAEAKIQGEIGKVVQAMQNDYQRSAIAERSLTQALEQQKHEALDLNRKGGEYGALSRDATSNRQIFESLMQRTKETAISGELRTSNIRIVDAAETPRRPASPNTRNNLLIGMLTGTILAVGLAFFFEYLDNRIKSPEELTRRLGLPFLGMIPALFELDASAPLISSAVPPNFSECFRTLRTNVLFSTAEEGLRSLVVTSTGPGEGKTLVATNLAVGLAQAGMRVLLIDADMRKPRVHMVFDKPRQPGLSNVLVGTAKFSETVHATTVPGLWMVPAGAYPPNPSELLSSKRFADLVASLGAHFDWAIIDTPPIMAVTDSSIVAHLTTGVVFVVGAEMTSRYAAQRAVEQLSRGRAKFLGAVLNRVDLQHNAYYYAEYYRREYSDYYSHSGGSAKGRKTGQLNL